MRGCVLRHPDDRVQEFRLRVTGTPACPLPAGKLLDIDVLDHMVIGQGRWVSLKERGLGFSG